MNEKSNLDSDSDSDEYVDLSKQIDDKAENIYQFALYENELILKHIGKCNIAPDIIIMENFGPNSNLSLYNCVYSESELKSDLETNQNNLNLFFPLVKLIKINNLNANTNIGETECLDISCIAVNLLKGSKEFENIFECKLEQNQILIREWELCWIENKHNEPNVKIVKLEKNITKENMIEKVLELGL